MACGMGLHIMYYSDIIDNFSEAVNCCQPLKTCSAKFILVSTPELSNTQHAKKMAILLWVGPSLLIIMGGPPLSSNILLENPNFGIQELMEN